MYISRIQIGNYKSFHAPPALDLAPGFNIIVGQNSSGKTAILEALGLDFSAESHRSLKTVPSVGVSPDPVSWVDVSFSLSREEFLDIVLASGNTTLFLPLPAIGSDFAHRIGFVANRTDDLDRLIEEVMSQENFTFNLRLEKLLNHGPLWKRSELPFLGLYPVPQTPDGQHQIFGRVGVHRNRTFTNSGFMNTASGNEVGVKLAPQFRSRIYLFLAERYNVGECSFGSNPQLKPDAANLPEVLNILQGNQSKFRSFNRLMNEILPDIRQVSVHPLGSNNDLQVLIWTLDPDTQRQDLAFPLSKSGTGIGQVLAMLYVVSTSTYPQTFLIDEPQSFLHPGAVRRLIEVLRRYPQHQFVIATHSPTVITSSNPETITLIRFQDGESVLENVNPTENNDLQLCLADLGARLSDVFGADRILWCEGPTEERCFPLILENIAQSQLMGTVILGIRRTGDLEGRDAERVFEIYGRLSQSSALLPPTVAFVLDRECRTTEAQEELQRKTQNEVIFLPRRMYENYLLHLAAICAVVNNIDGFRAPPVTEDEVEAIIEAKKSIRNYFCQDGPDGTSPDWVHHIDAANVLKDIFSELSEERVSFQKTKHSVALTEWIIQNAPEELQEITDILVGCLEGNH